MSCTPHRPWLLISSVAAYLDLTGCQGQGIPRSTNTASTENFEMSWFVEFIWKETTLKDREGNTFFRNGPIKRKDWKKKWQSLADQNIYSVLPVCFISLTHRFKKNEWIEVCLTLERMNLSILNLDQLSSTFYFHRHLFTFISIKKMPGDFPSGPRSCFMSRSPSFHAVFCAKEHISKYWSSQSTCEPRVESPNHRIANLNETTNVTTPENSGISAEKSWLEDDISFSNGPFSEDVRSISGGRPFWSIISRWLKVTTFEVHHCPPHT